MSYKSYPWRSDKHDRVLTSDELARFFRGRFSDGVSSGLIVKTAGGMSVQLTDGFAAIEGRQFASYTDLDGTTKIDCGISNGTYSMYVSIFLRLTKSLRDISPICKRGVPSANPTVPARQSDEDVKELRLADILIPKGATEITQDMIRNTIAGPECGISINQPQSVDSAAFSAELDAWLDLYKTAKDTEFTQWFEAVKTLLNDNAAGNLYNAINQQPKIVIAELDQDGNPIFPTGDGTYIVIA